MNFLEALIEEFLDWFMETFNSDEYPETLKIIYLN